MRKLLLTFLILLSTITGNTQQFKIDADYRARAEYSNGFGTLISSGTDFGLFVEQRARLGFGYSDNYITSSLSFQDVSVWGDKPQITSKDINRSLSLAEAWVNVHISKHWSTKVGRQTIAYDDERIFGGLDWAMQGRFHDALLLNYKKANYKLVMGFAFNQNAVSRENTLFDPNNSADARAVFDYKSMAYLWVHKDWNTISTSFLFLNNTYQNIQGETPVKGNINRQTFGTHVEANSDKALKFLFNFYAQTGEFSKGIALNAYNSSLEIQYKPKSTLLSIGYEVLSGDNTANNEITSFFPVFGTNHKFNGFMDYFYVGNHANNIGLRDLYAKAIFVTGKKSKLLTKVHYFSGDKSIDNEYYLGTELDIVFTQKITPYASVKVGYSQMFASETMEKLKNVSSPNSIQNWGWLMLVVKPNLLNWKKNKEII